MEGPTAGTRTAEDDLTSIISMYPLSINVIWNEVASFSSYSLLACPKGSCGGLGTQKHSVRNMLPTAATTTVGAGQIFFRSSLSSFDAFSCEANGLH